MTINEILETMDYGTAPETASEALAWLDKNRPFGNFINGKMTDAGNTFCVTSPATGDELARVTQATAADVDAAVAAARAALGKWSKLGGQGRARVLYALARLYKNIPVCLPFWKLWTTVNPFAKAVMLISHWRNDIFIIMLAWPR